MTSAIAGAAPWLLQGARLLADTLYTKQVAVAPTLFERVTAVASGILTIAILVFVVAAVPAAWNFRSSYKNVNALLERIYGDINPLMRHASSIADNVDYITTSIRADVQQLNATLALANQRLQQAVAQTEARLNEFNALLHVVQEEAEHTFVATAAGVRGVRTGATAFTADEPLLGRAGPKFATPAADRLASFRDELDAAATYHDDEENAHGDDRDTETAEDGSPRPRVRPRRRAR